MLEAPNVDERNLARLMVRRHLRSWLGSDIISEQLLAAMFIRAMHEHPDRTMKDVATLVDAEINELVAIVLGRPLEDQAPFSMVDDRVPDGTGLDPG